MDILLTDKEKDRIRRNRIDVRDMINKLLKAQIKKAGEWLESYEICDPITHKLEGYWISVEDMLEFTATGEEATNETA